MDIRRFKHAGSEIVKLVRDIRWAKQDVTGLGDDRLFADRELRSPRAHDEDLVVGMDVQTRPLSDFFRGEKQNGYVRTDVRPLNYPPPQMTSRSPIAGVENYGFASRRAAVVGEMAVQSFYCVTFHFSVVVSQIALSTLRVGT